MPRDGGGLRLLCPGPRAFGIRLPSLDDITALQLFGSYLARSQTDGTRPMPRRHIPESFKRPAANNAYSADDEAAEAEDVPAAKAVTKAAAKAKAAKANKAKAKTTAALETCATVVDVESDKHVEAAKAMVAMAAARLQAAKLKVQEQKAPLSAPIEFEYMSLFNPVRADVNTLRVDMFLLSRRPQLNMHLHLALGCGVGLVDLFVCRAVVQVNDPRLVMSDSVKHSEFGITVIKLICFSVDWGPLRQTSSRHSQVTCACDWMAGGLRPR